MIHTGDCIEVMAGMDADSVDAIVTDPPYGLGFMGKEWDSGKARHLPPSAEPLDTPLARFRTGKGPAAVAFDGHPFQAWCEAWGREALRVTKPGGYLLAFGGTRTHHRLVCGLEDAGWIIRDELDWIYASGFPKGKANLKPAHEPIVLARKPGPLRPLAIDACRIGTEGWSRQDREAGAGFSTGKFMGSMGNGEPTMKNGLRESAAGRWPSNVLLSDPALFDEPNPEVVGSGTTTQSTPFEWAKDRQTEPTIYGGGKGIPFDKEAMEGGYGDSGGYSRFFVIPKADRADREPVVRGQIERQSRSTLNAYAKPSEGRTAPKNGSNPRENAHPTVKPVDLMRHLVRLVTPQGGTVLDPFLGSGSTAIAAELEGFPWIGIEKEESYVAIAEARLNGTQRGLGLDVPAPNAPAKRSTGHWPKERTPGSEGWGFTGQTGLEERYDK
jgi:DNA modification methylase